MFTLALASGVLPGSASGGGGSQGPDVPPVALLPAEEAWMVHLPAPPAADGAMDDVHVYVPLQSGQIIALNRQTGDTVWTRTLASRSPLLAADGGLYASGADEMQALDPGTGRTIWRVPIAHEGAALALADGLLLVSTSAGLVALDVVSGERKWARPIEATGALASIVADGRAVYAASIDARFTALSLSGGDTYWTHTLSGTLRPPAVARDRVFVGSSARTFYAFHAESGRLEWRWRTGGGVMGAVADDDRVYLVTLDNLLRAVNRGNGHQRWRRQLPTRPVAPPAVVGRHVLIPGVSPALATFDTSTGAPIATYDAPVLGLGLSPALQGSPLIDSVLDSSRVGCVLVLRDGRAVGLRARGVSDEPRVEPEPVVGRPDGRSISVMTPPSTDAAAAHPGRTPGTTAVRLP